MSQCTPAAGRDFALGELLGAAFPPSDGREDAALRTGSVAAPRGLRRVVPRGEPADGEALEEEAGRHRVLVMRGGATVPVQALLALGGALLFHMLIAGVFVAGWYFAWRSLAQGGGGSDGDGVGIQGAVLDDVPGALAAPEALPALGEARDASPPAPVPLLPPLPDQLSGVVQSVSKELGAGPAPTLAPAAQDLGTVHLPTPAVASAAGAGMDGRNGTSVASAGGDPAGAGDEPVINLMRGSGSGSGSGGGSGRGRGVNRGPGADMPEPRILDNPLPPNQPTPRRAVTLEVLVLADGRIGDIKVVDSSGQPEVDEYFRSAVWRWRFSPAIIGGKPVSETTKITLGPFRE